MQIIRKTVAASDGGLEYVLSDGTVDRYGDVVDARGWVLTNFLQNPIALFGHSSSFPIGTWSNLRVEAGKLVGKLNLAAKGTSARIDELISLVEQGILRAVSVGFRPLEAEPLDKDRPHGGQRYKRQELLETSLVAIPANPASVAIARSLHVSDKTMSLVFGEQADAKRREVSATGEQAEKTTADVKHKGLPPPPKAKSMSTLARRIEDAQTDLVAKRDRLTELTGVDEPDVEAIEELTTQIDTQERSVKALKAAEAKIGIDAGLKSSGTTITAPAIARRPLGYPQKEISGLDLLVRSAVAFGCSRFGGKQIERVLDELYPGQEAIPIMLRADQTVGTTTVSGWAAELAQTSYGGLMQAIDGKSIYPELRDRGMQFSFDGNGTVSIPSETAGGAGGGFVAEGAPIRVGRITVSAAPMTAKKLGVIIPFTRELAKRSTPQIELVVRRRIIADTSSILDSALLDNVAASTARPAGLLNGVSATASGTAGGDFEAVVADLKALLAPFTAANASDGITLIMHPNQGLALSMMPGPGDGRFGWANSLTSRFTIVESTHATANRLIAIRNQDFATALGDMPEFDVSETATIHMEDVTPLEIVSGTGPTTADPVRSLWQTGTMGVRMIMDVSWQMVRTGMVRWIDTTTW